MNLRWDNQVKYQRHRYLVGRTSPFPLILLTAALRRPWSPLIWWTTCVCFIWPALESSSHLRLCILTIVTQTNACLKQNSPGVYAWSYVMNTSTYSKVCMCTLPGIKPSLEYTENCPQSNNPTFYVPSLVSRLRLCKSWEFMQIFTKERCLIISDYGAIWENHLGLMSAQLNFLFSASCWGKLKGVFTRYVTPALPANLAVCSAGENHLV